MNIIKVQDAFCEEAIEYMYELDKEFYTKYFIELVPKRILKNQRYTPDKKLKLSGKQNICIRNYLMDNFDTIMNNTYKYLEIEPIKDIEEKFNWTGIIDELVPDINIFLNINEENILQELKDKGIIKDKVDIQNISELNDKIGDEQELSDYLDFNNRDKALIDLDGTILIGENNQTHAQVLQDYLNKISDETLVDGWTRPGNDEINKLFNNSYSAFGHILNNNIFLETFSLNNIPLNKVLNDIKESGINYEKIYEYDCESIKRVAKNERRKVQ